MSRQTSRNVDTKFECYEVTYMDSAKFDIVNDSGLESCLQKFEYKSRLDCTRPIEIKISYLFDSIARHWKHPTLPTSKVVLYWTPRSQEGAAQPMLFVGEDCYQCHNLTI